MQRTGEAVPDRASRAVRMKGADRGRRCVHAEFSDGTSARGDFLVGADGLHSHVRSAIHGDRPPRYAGCTAWRGVVTFTQARVEATETWGQVGTRTRDAARRCGAPDDPVSRTGGMPGDRGCASARTGSCVRQGRRGCPSMAQAANPVLVAPRNAVLRRVPPRVQTAGVIGMLESGETHAPIARP